METQKIKIKDCSNALFPFAYRVLNSIEDAKDMAQEVMTDYISSKNSHVENPRNYLIRSVINKSINLKNRNKKTQNAPSFHNEPIASNTADLELNLEDMAKISFQILSYKLNIKERAVFILKEAFNYNHQEISEVLSLTTDNSRKILSRAKSKLKSTTFSIPKKVDQDTVDCLQSFITAIKNRNLAKLKELMEID